MVCPNCGVKIKFYDLSPHCKNCGINIQFFTQEQDLACEAKITELEFAKARAVVKRIKATYITSKLVIARMVTGLLTLACVVLPFLTLKVNLPLTTTEFSTGVIGIYKMIASGSLGQIFNLLNIGVLGTISKVMFAHIVIFVVAMVFAFADAWSFLLASINPKRSAKYMTVISGIISVMNLMLIVSSFVLRYMTRSIDCVTTEIGIGSFALLVMLGTFFLLNLKLWRNVPEIEISETDQKRIAMFKEYKQGKLNLDELPLPIFETQEERENRINLFGITHEGEEGESDGK